jgi:hypothetical protein
MDLRFVKRALREPLPAAIEVFNVRSSEHRLALLPRQPAPLHGEDSLWTYHGLPFLDEPRFVRAYERAMKAGGFDYGIRWRTHVILWVAQLAATLDGAFVECGTGKGFMASAICEHLAWSTRPFYLYDTFEPASRERERPFYADGPESVIENFSEWPGVRVVVGRIPDTLLDTKPVAFLHVDLNNAAAEEAAVRHFWPRLSRGAPLLFDDYNRVGYKELGEKADRLGVELGFEVLTMPTGQGLVIKTD